MAGQIIEMLEKVWWWDPWKGLSKKPCLGSFGRCQWRGQANFGQEIVPKLGSDRQGFWSSLFQVFLGVSGLRGPAWEDLVGHVHESKSFLRAWDWRVELHSYPFRLCDDHVCWCRKWRKGLLIVDRVEREEAKGYSWGCHFPSTKQPLSPNYFFLLFLY